jgi:hypothetical protein
MRFFARQFAEDSRGGCPYIFGLMYVQKSTWKCSCRNIFLEDVLKTKNFLRERLAQAAHVKLTTKRMQKAIA